MSRTLVRGAVAMLLAVLGVAPAGPAAADGGNAGLVHACVNRWTQVRIVGPNDACDPGERSLHWVLTGPDGSSTQGGGGTTCPAGTLSCGSAGCVNVATDVRNCGACGHVCSAGQACTAGACQTLGTTCPPGSLSCGPAGCVNVATDVRNCGACGHVCSAANAAAAACANGVCQVAACNAGFADCNRDASDGCETHVVTDVRNCGACGRACPAGAACVNGACSGSTAACPAGTTRCGSQCVNLAGDSGNCGTCGRACGSNAGCLNGSCQPMTFGVCPNPMIHCGAQCVNPSADSANCGACGRACAPGQACVAGTCRSGP